MSQTDRASYVFTVKEYADGTPWIMLETLRDDLELLKDGFLGFDLPKGTSFDKAKEIAKYMRDNLGDMTYTHDLG